MVKRVMVYGVLFLMGLFQLVRPSYGEATEADTVDTLALIQPLLPALVWVEYTLGYDEGLAPKGMGWGEVCPNCGQIHGNQVEQRMQEERTIRAPGFVVAENRVLTADFMVEQRFIRRIDIQVGEARYLATIEAYREDGPGILLAVEGIGHIPVLAFVSEGEGPFVSVRRAFLNGMDQVLLADVGARPVTLLGEGASFTTTAAGSLIVDQQGRPVGVSLTGELDRAGHWKGNPLDGRWLGMDGLAERMAALAAITEKGIVQVKLHFRSPPSVPGQSSSSGFMRSFSQGGSSGRSVDENATEHETVGLVVAPDRVLVLAGLPPALTARLERVDLQTAGGEYVAASFVGTLLDYEALLVEPLEPLPDVLALDFSPIHAYRRQLLLGAEVDVESSHRDTRIRPLRFEALEEGYRGQILPSFVLASTAVFVFHGERLLVMPMQRRDRMRLLQGGRFSSSTQRFSHPLAYWQEILRDPLPFLDPSNRPLHDDEAMRVAWVGVELQAMRPELALAHGVLRQTENGQRGGIVTRIYAESPAAAAGLQVGDILLWLETDGLPGPVQVRVDTSGEHYSSFRWEMLDQISAQYFDQIPPPWPNVRSGFNLMLTQLGVGATVDVSLFRDGKPLRKRFVLEQSPLAYDSAARFQHTDTGVTVRDFTYEVRSYLQAAASDPGVVVARVESGSKAWIAGVRPYELITHVDGEPVHTVAAFEARMQQPGDKQLTVKRMASSRLARIAE